MRATNPHHVRLPLGIDDIDADLADVAAELKSAAGALRAAESALGSCDWQELPGKLESLREALSASLAVLDTVQPEALAIAHRTQGDW